MICYENPQCDKLFHASCLNQHLNVNSYEVLSIAVGECLFCKQTYLDLCKEQQDMTEQKRPDIMIESSMIISG